MPSGNVIINLVKLMVTVTNNWGVPMRHKILAVPSMIFPGLAPMVRVLGKIKTALIILALWLPVTTMGQNYCQYNGMYIRSQESTPVYLGYVIDNQFHSDSIINTFGSYGSSYSTTSIRNSFSAYGSSYGVYSAYNNLASSPPIIYYYLNSTFYFVAYLTKNTLKYPRVDPDGLIAALQAGCGVTPTRIIRLTGDLAFGNVTVGSSATRTLTIYNDGNSTLTVSSISYPSGFSGAWSGTIAAGGSRAVTVTFSPGAAQSYSGTITVNSDKTSGTPTISCSGTGVATPTRIIRLTGDLAFGNVAVGSSATRTLTIYNDGNSALTVSSISYPSGFSGNWSGTIAAGGSRDVTVTFAPSAVQGYSGNLTVNSDKTSGTSTRSVSGTGVTPTRIIRLTGDLAFGSVTAGQTATRTLTIYNDGNSALTVSSISYPSGFSGNWSGTIAAGSSSAVTVTFSPTLVQSYSGTVTVASDKTSGDNTSAISGTGTAVPTRIIRLAGDLAFGSVTAGQTATRTLTIYNDGNSALTVSSISYPSGFSGNWSGTIAAGGSRDVTVTFSPMSIQEYNGDITVQSDSTSGNDRIGVLGIGAAPAVTINPVTRIFGSNGGAGNIHITALDGTACLWTSRTDNAWVNIVPPMSGSDTNLLYNVAENNGSARRGLVDINGTIHEVIQEPSDQLKEQVYFIESHSIDGGLYLSAQKPSDARLNIEYSTTLKQPNWVKINHITENAPFLFSAIDTNISFTGFYRLIRDDTPSTRIIRLEGNLAFGEVIVGQNATRSLTIYNDGNSRLTVTNIAYPAGYSGAWSGSIAAGSSQAVTVMFVPLAGLSYSGILEVNSDATDGTYTMPVSGTGIIFIPVNMVLIPGGTNEGTNPLAEGESYNQDSYPATYNLSVDSFYMDKYEVTRALFHEVYFWAITNGYSFENGGTGKGNNYPVHSVNWYDCVKWCNARSEMENRPAVYTVNGAVYRRGQSNNVVQSSAVGYRLPTDAEWEYAARGGFASHRYPWDDSDEIQHARANYWSSTQYSYDTSPTRGYHPTYYVDGYLYDNSTCPVDAFAPNGFGLHNMAGNVWEWCFDWYPGREGSQRVFRGGEYAGGANACRVGQRFSHDPNEIYLGRRGFRTVLPSGQH